MEKTGRTSRQYRCISLSVRIGGKNGISVGIFCLFGIRTEDREARQIASGRKIIDCKFLCKMAAGTRVKIIRILNVSKWPARQKYL